MDSDYATGEPLEVRRMRPALRALTVLVWGASGVLFIALALRFPSRGRELGFLLGGACLATALYWLRAPAVRVTVRGNGFSYVDPRFGVLLRFPVRHASWADVLAVDTREIASRYGTYVRTRLTVRAGDGVHRRTLSVTSRDEGYARFLDLLAAQTSGRAIESTGLGVEAAGVRLALRRIRAGQLRTVATFALLGAVLVLIAYVTRR